MARAPRLKICVQPTERFVQLRCVGDHPKQVQNALINCDNRSFTPKHVLQGRQADPKTDK
jgi:hypothetical protein